MPDAQAALAGARDILAEEISDDARLRAELRRFYHAFGLSHQPRPPRRRIASTPPTTNFPEPVRQVADHRVLAMDRGEREGFLKVQHPGGRASGPPAALPPGSLCGARAPAPPRWSWPRRDAYTRLLHPALERELRAELTEQADEGAIRVFG